MPYQTLAHIFVFLSQVLILAITCTTTILNVLDIAEDANTPCFYVALALFLLGNVIWFANAFLVARPSQVHDASLPFAMRVTRNCFFIASLVNVYDRYQNKQMRLFGCGFTNKPTATAHSTDKGAKCPCSLTSPAHV